MLEVGDVIDKYRIEALIGQGGMAAVYRARHVALDSLHAVKVLFITAPEVRRRLILEGRVQANLRHPNIVSVTDVLELGGAPALVMEYVDGPSLDDWLREGAPPLDVALAVFRGVVRGMAAAHERGVIHRDLKPANIVLADDGEGFVPKITDFGLVKSLGERSGRTLTGMAMGTPEYMAPEQIRDASDVDQRVDMFALGCILYELVCGRRAFAGADNVATFNAIVEGRYTPPEVHVPDLPSNVRTAIDGLLQVDRDRRIADCERLMELLFRDEVVPRARAPRGPVRLLHLRSTMPELHRMVTPAGQPRAATPVPPARAKIPPEAPEAPASPLGIIAAMAAGVVLGVGISVGLQLLPLQGGSPGRVEPVAAPLAEPNGAPATEPATAAAVVEPPPAEGEPAPTEADPDPEPAPPTESPGVDRAPDAPTDGAARETPPEPSPHASVSLTGDARRAWLVQGDRRIPAEGPVPAGTWRILADFGGPEPVIAGEVTLRPGERITLACSSFLFQCRER